MMSRVGNMFEKADERSQKYLQAVCENIGLLGINHGWKSITGLLKGKEIEFEQVAAYSTWCNLTGSGKVDIYRYSHDGQTRYAAEYCHRVAIDDYDICSYIYSQEPGNKTILETKALEDIEWEFIRGREPIIQCWECGHECHFCDIVARDMEEKLDRWQESFCGRCDKT